MHPCGLHALIYSAQGEWDNYNIGGGMLHFAAPNKSCSLWLCFEYIQENLSDMNNGLSNKPRNEALNQDEFKCTTFCTREVRPTRTQNLS